MTKKNTEKASVLPSIAYLAAPAHEKPELQASLCYLYAKFKENYPALSSLDAIYKSAQNLRLHSKQQIISSRNPTASLLLRHSQARAYYTSKESML